MESCPVKTAVTASFPVGEERTVLAAGVPVAVRLSPHGSENLISIVRKVLALYESAMRDSTSRWIVGISGPAGAGKSTLGGMLVSVLNSIKGENFSCLLGVDGYHKMNSTLDEEGTRVVKGRPMTLDVASFVRDVRRIKFQQETDGPVGLPLYDRPSHNPISDALLVPPPPMFPVAIIEGILLFTEGNGFEPLYTENADSTPLLDLRIYLDLPEPKARKRVNGRKVAGGRHHEEVEGHYLRVDFKNHEEMERGKRHAQLLLKPSLEDEDSYEMSN